MVPGHQHQWCWFNTGTCALITRFMRPTWGPSGADRTQVGPVLAPWTLLSWLFLCNCIEALSWVSRSHFKDNYSSVSRLAKVNMIFHIHIQLYQATDIKNTGKIGKCAESLQRTWLSAMTHQTNGCLFSSSFKLLTKHLSSALLSEGNPPATKGTHTKGW